LLTQVLTKLSFKIPLCVCVCVCVHIICCTETAVDDISQNKKKLLQYTECFAATSTNDIVILGTLPAEIKI